MPRPRSRRTPLLGAVVILGSGLIGLAAVEAVFQVRERRQAALTFHIGDGGRSEPDPRLGWKPTIGAFRSRSPEFDSHGEINDHFMNDRPESAADADAVRILALGDSHTFAVGASQSETWVRRLEDRLNAAASPGTRYRTYNAGMIGYSVHQYLLRLIDEGPRIKPSFVVVGLSFATDLFDLLPPERGGWIYGGDAERDYFDFADDGTLTERHSPPGAAATGSAVLAGRTFRNTVLRSATARYFRRSPVALFLASRLRLDGTSVWTNMDVVMERDIDPSHEYQHRLFRALLARLADVSRRGGAQLVVVGIPYLPQIYDEIRQTVFADDRFDADALSNRVRSYCEAVGALYVDTTPAMRTASQASGHWLHYRDDGHPTPEGHAVIARAIAEAGIITVPGRIR